MTSISADDYATRLQAVKDGLQLVFQARERVQAERNTGVAFSTSLVVGGDTVISAALDVAAFLLGEDMADDVDTLGDEQ